MTYVAYADAKINEWVWSGIYETAQNHPTLAGIDIVLAGVGSLFEMLAYDTLRFAEELLSLPWEGRCVNVLQYGAYLILSPFRAIFYAVYIIAEGILGDPVSFSRRKMDGAKAEAEQLHDLIKLRSSSFSQELADRYCLDHQIVDDAKKQFVFEQYEMERKKFVVDSRDSYELPCVFVDRVQNLADVIEEKLKLS